MQESFTFSEKKYAIIRKAISSEMLDLIANYVQLQLSNKYFGKDVIASKTKYADMVMEALLLTIQPRIEQIVKKQLVPTYSYMRVYQKGDVLLPHCDREACEYSTSLTISYDADYLWPLFVVDNGKKTDIPLDRGDLLVYKGCEVEHGRDIFAGNWWTQVFMHYVEKRGKYDEWRFDKRDNLGANEAGRRLTNGSWLSGFRRLLVKS